MKIALVMSGLGHVVRGAEAWAKGLAYALDKENVNVTLIKGGGKEGSEIERVIPCIKRSSSILGGSRSPIPWFRRVQVEQNSFMLFVIPYLSMHQFDILHIGGPTPLLMLAKSTGFIKQKILCTYHTRYDPRFIYTSDAITQPAPYYVEKARREGIDTRKWFSLPNFVDTEKFNPQLKSRTREELGIPGDAFLVLSVGAIIRRYKRMHYVIKEVAQISKTANVYLLIVGQEEDETPQIKRLGKQLLGDRIRFASKLPDEKMPQVYASSDVFVLASLREFFGIAFLEAMASGKPVLGNSYDVTKWIIGKGGETTDMSQENNLSNVLKKYIENPDLRIEKGKIARSRVEDLFSTEKIVKDAIRIYQQVLED